MAEDPQEIVTLVRDGDIAVIRLDDGKANAITHTVVDGLTEALAAAGDAKAIALVGREGRFSAGFDLATMTAGIDQAQGLLNAGARVAISLYTSPVPVVVGCTGHALAMGAILLMCADVRIGAVGAYKIGLNEVAIGMPVPRFAAALGHDRLSPTQRVLALQLATVFSPAGAVEAGFLDELVASPPDASAAAIAKAHELAAYVNPAAFRATRRHLRGEVATRLGELLVEDTKTFTLTQN